ncbi:MAG: PAS domain S-box protein [Methanomassiliicoccus sp.]|nr:PAS domain S-box protein [Methanomassiliicoccus sp.]
MPGSNDKSETSAQKELRTLRDYVHLLADAIDKSPMPFVAGYPDGRTMAFNEAFAKLTGYSEEELRGMQWVMYLTPPEWHEREAQAMEELRKTGHPQTYEKEQMGKDGSRILVQVVLGQTTDKDGKVLYYYALIKDHTEKQRADRLEKELQEAQESGSGLESVFEGAAIFQNGKLVVANSRFAEIADYSTSELMGLEEGQLMLAGSRGLVPTKIADSSSTHEGVLNRKDGSTVAVEMRAQDVQYKGAPARMVRILDISDRAKFQEDREQLLKQLAGVSEELTALRQVAAMPVNVVQPEQAMDSLLRNLTTIVRADSGSVLVREGDRLVARSIQGSADKYPSGYSEDAGSGFPGKVIGDNQGVFVEDAQSDPEVSEPLKATGARSLLGVPIRHSSTVIGLLQVVWSSPHAQNDREMRLLEVAADRCASAIAASKISETSKASEEFGSVLSEIHSQLSSTLNLGMAPNR